MLERPEGGPGPAEAGGEAGPATDEPTRTADRTGDAAGKRRKVRLKRPREADTGNGTGGEKADDTDADPVTGLAVELAAARADRDLLQAIIDNLPEHVYVKDLHGRFVISNRPDSEDLLGKTVFELFDDDLADQLADEDMRVFESGEPVRDALHVVPEDGEIRWLETTKTPLRDADGTLIGLVGADRDVTGRRRIEQQLRESQSRLAAAQRIAGLGSWWIDVSTDGEFVESTQRWSDETFRIFGYDPGSVDVRQAFEVFNRHLHPDDAGQMRREMLHALQQGKDASVEYRIVRPDGEVRAVRQRCSVVFDEHNGRPVRFIGTLQDVTDTKRLEERLSHQASHDALTGLPNRRALLRRLEGAFASGGAVAVLFCDVDHFAMINTRFGHEGGDRLLSQLGQRMREALPPECMLGRWGGDEFVAIADGGVDARALGVRLQEAVRAPIAVDGVPVRLDLSVGVAYGPAGGAEQVGPEDVLRDADLAMRGVRGEGGGQIGIADDEIRRLARRRRDLTQGLRTALEDGELTLAYQPRVSLDDGGLRAFEAELRWEHPDHGVVPAGELAWVAEESGAIHAVGAWVLETACRQLAAWQRRYAHLVNVAVAVRLSAAQLDRTDLVEEVAAILQASGLPAGSLELAITESVLMADPVRNADVLDELRELGVRLTVEDFGGGFSSLAYLHRFPLHTLKIDRAFAAGVAVAGGDREIVRLLLAVATELGLRTVAEGVDAAEAAQVLRELGCEQAQGALFARPMPAPAAERLLASAVRHPATAPPPSPRPPSG